LRAYLYIRSSRPVPQDREKDRAGGAGLTGVGKRLEKPIMPVRSSAWLAVSAKAGTLA
jgi:hypothetical protein